MMSELGKLKTSAIRRSYGRTLNGILEGLAAHGRSLEKSSAPVFILGAPRSGSTVTMQLLCRSLRIGYISNAMCQVPGFPSRMVKSTTEWSLDAGSDFVSDYGLTFHDHSPSECGEWWYRFFPRSDKHLTLQDVSPRKMRNFVNSLSLLEHEFGLPILFKNLYVALRLRPLITHLPQSIFIILHRDLADNALSLLAARYENSGDYRRWWSLRPPMAPDLDTLPAEQQVVEQIRGIHALIESDLALMRVPDERVLHLDYNQVCSDPALTVSRVTSFLEDAGSPVEMKHPPPITMSERVPLLRDTPIHERLIQYLHNHS